MMHAKRSTMLAAGLVAAILAMGSAVPAGAENFDQSLSLSGESLVLVDLIGEITVEGHDGSEFLVDVHVQGEDASKKTIKIESDEGRKSRVIVQFPLDEESHYVYPRMGRGSRTTFQLRNGHEENSSWLDKLLQAVGQDRIRVSGSGSGFEAWADVTVQVPEGKKLQIELGVGEISASNVKGEVVLETHSGPVRAGSIEGDVVIDTGSGHVEVEDVTGDLLVDTGSGHVEARGVSGKTVDIDTGSGRVRTARVDCSRLRIDTGSGSVRALAIRADEANIDTGSGSVELELERMGGGRFLIDTGSGSIDLALPTDASADVVAETASGGIHLDLADVRIRNRERDHVAFRVGDGDASVSLDTGSGSIAIRQ
jgi:hypothetical protein